MSDVSPQGKYEVLGNILLAERGQQDPFQEDYLSEVRPRACGMGGTAIALMQAATATSGLHSGSNTHYAVLRERVPEASVQLPQTSL